MDKPIKKILTHQSKEYREAFRIYQIYYPETGLLASLKTIFYPLKLTFSAMPKVAPSEIMIDCANLEKYKRIASIVPFESKPLLYVSDVSTARSLDFYQSIRHSMSVIAKPFRTKGYWLGISVLWVGSLQEFTFRAKAFQLLLQYQWLFKKTKTQFLMTANEDSWISPLLAQYCRLVGIKNINVMHGRAYDALQFYDQSIVYGRACEKKTSALASNQTKVVRIALDDFQSADTPKPVNRMRIVFFDQPVFEHYSIGLKQSIYQALGKLADQGYEIAVKPHPAQKVEGDELLKGFTLIRGEPNKSLLKRYGIAVAVCSTVGIESLAAGVPIIYVNEHQVLTHFLQITFFTPTAVKNSDDLVTEVNRLQNEEDYLKFYEIQQNAFHHEYDVDPAVNPVILNLVSKRS